MKKLLYILLLLPALVFGQTIENNRIVFRETFDDEFSVRRNGGTPTDVTFSNRVATFNGTSSEIAINLINLGTVFTFVYEGVINDVSGSYHAIAGHDDVSYPMNINPSLGRVLLNNGTNGEQSNEDTRLNDGKWHQIVVTLNGTLVIFYLDGENIGNPTLISSFPISISRLGNRANGFRYGGTMDKVEAYNYDFSAEEVENLYNNRRFRDIGQANEILNISAQSGSIIDRQGNTLTNTATTVFKHGDASVMEFNGSSSVIETTLANTIKTVSFWIYTDDLTQSIADFGSGNTVTVSGGTITAAWADNIYINGETGTDISINEWFLVILTDAGIAVTDIDIGKEGANFYKGFLNDFHLYDGILTAEEISQLFSSTKYLYSK